MPLNTSRAAVNSVLGTRPEAIASSSDAITVVTRSARLGRRWLVSAVVFIGDLLAVEPGANRAWRICTPFCLTWQEGGGKEKAVPFLTPLSAPSRGARRVGA